MARLDGIDAWLEEHLPRLLVEHNVPAASVAVGAGDEAVAHAFGTLSTGTGIEATTDAIFQVGSITKVFTATLVLQLVEEGLITLDDPVRAWLPEFELADADAAARTTVRHLLCHIAGFEGDIFTDTGKGDDCLLKFVALLAQTPQLFAPGQLWSYNNAGFCVLGRLVEVVRGRAYDACLRHHLLDRLGDTHAAVDPYEAVVHRVAVGHVRTSEGGELQPTRTWAMARSNAPAGSMLAMRATDLLAFARVHLNHGRASAGQLLSAATVATMQEAQVALPDIAQGSAWGLGWELFDLPGGRLVGHDGNTIGQSAMLRLFPERDVSVVVLTNGGAADLVQRAVLSRVLSDVCGLELPGPPEPNGIRVGRRSGSDLDRFVGRYTSVVAETVVSQDSEGHLWLERKPIGVLADLDELPYRTELVAWRGDSFLPLQPESGRYQPVAFLGDDGSGRAAFLHAGRADRRAP